MAKTTVVTQKIRRMHDNLNRAKATASYLIEDANVLCDRIDAYEVKNAEIILSSSIFLIQEQVDQSLNASKTRLDLSTRDLKERAFNIIGHSPGIVDDIVNKIKGVIKSALEPVFTALSNISNHIGNRIANAVGVMASIMDRALTGVVSGIKTAISASTTAITTGINAVKAGVNTALNAINEGFNIFGEALLYGFQLIASKFDEYLHISVDELITFQLELTEKFAEKQAEYIKRKYAEGVE